jgi:hypothetical protein
VWRLEPKVRPTQGSHFFSSDLAGNEQLKRPDPPQNWQIERIGPKDLTTVGVR